MTADAPPPLFSPTSAVVTLSQFQSANVGDVITAVRTLPDKSCALHPLPTTLFKAVADFIAQFLTELFNRSLSARLVPDVFKEAFTTPRLKKTDMDPTDVRPYRPISNLSVLSKLLECLKARQLLSYLDTSGLLPRLQSAYRARHATETAMLKVLLGILLAIDAGDLSVLVLLNLSADFDTV